jgi:2-polyprenyl-3-methyl-5-hydroxy-6-metoxy-1,4-benzoquinol methylase
MLRYDKKTMSIHSLEYDELLKKEIEVWSNYVSGEGKGKVSSYEEIKKTHAYITYRKGTIELELDYIKNIGKNISILELGSADGWLTNEILKLDNVKDITSIDISLEKNKTKYSEKSTALRGDLNKINLIAFDQNYDCIITHGTLHHLVDPKKTLEFCLNNLLKKNGILIVNDTWVLRAPQLKLNAFFYLFLNRLPHSVLDLNIIEFSKILFYKIPHTLISKDFAASIAHSHETSPFESVSSADDYKEIYDRQDLENLYFQNLAALPGLQNSWMSSPLFIKKIIQSIDTFLIRNKILTGDFYISVVKKIS